MSGVRKGRVVKLVKIRRRLNAPVLRMMAIMQDGNSQKEVPKEFLDTGRTGRRNALPDILHEDNASASTADLPARLQRLATEDGDNAQPGPSSSQAASPAAPPEPEKKGGS